jgi:DNA primase
MRGAQLADQQGGREWVLMALILNHPTLLRRQDEAFSSLEFTSLELDSLRTAILHEAARNSDLDTEGLKRHLTEQGFADTLARVGGRKATDLHWFAQPEAALEDAEKGWKLILARHRAAALRGELRLAEDALAEEMTDERLHRFLALKRQVESGEGDAADLEGFGAASGREAAI